jgi:hypothetical protein
MRIRIPTPLKGWRVFAGEVGTILVGVLLALGAQELVQNLHWTREVKETRGALDAEVARDLAAFDYRFDQRPCVAKRLSELGRWAESHRSGTPLKLKKDIQPPPGFEIRSAVWEVTDGEIATRIPLQAKLGYATIYDSMKSFSDLTDSEEEQWIALLQFQNSLRLEEADLQTVENAIRLLGAMNEALAGYRIAIDKSAHELKITPDKDIEAKSSPVIAKWNQEMCKPLL